jgi:2-polyprenyl-6-methoxyphenol hydroxylase-like FAD-dependent oxidoreductase
MSYDVVILGARVGGGSLALALARQGYRVMLVDRDQFPSDTLSTHFMNPLAVGQLASLGVLADIEPLDSGASAAPARGSRIAVSRGRQVPAGPTRSLPAEPSWIPC